MSQNDVVKFPPPPPLQVEDTVNDLGWLSHGPARRARAEAERRIEPLLLEEGEDSGLPPDPTQPPPLPPPPDQEPDTKRRGRKEPVSPATRG